MDTKTNMPLPQSGEEKATAKAYRSPQLVEYGNIQQLTNAVGGTGKMDGGKAKGTTKTA